MTSYEIGVVALRPLMRTFWSAQGWRSPAQFPITSEFKKAVQSGVMFDAPLARNHDEWIQAARTAVTRIRLEDVSQAFIASLLSRRLDLRSALASFAVARHLPEHSFEAGKSPRYCRVCGLASERGSTDLNVLSFERFKWGGVRHSDIPYIAFDLEQFQNAPREPLTNAAVAVGLELLNKLADVDAAETASSLAAKLTILRGNIAEREVVVDILGICGLLATVEHDGFLLRFIPFADRCLPSRHFVDRPYPVCWWRGSNGVSADAAKQWFPALTTQLDLKTSSRWSAAATLDGARHNTRAAQP